MEPNQVHLVAAAVSGDSQQIIHAFEPRFTGQIVGDVGDGNRRNRIHDDVAVVHPVAATHLHMGTRPDANTAFDSPAPDSFAKAFAEQHWKSAAAADAEVVAEIVALADGTVSEEALAEWIRQHSASV
jgi:hypothetical protein